MLGKGCRPVLKVKSPIYARILTSPVEPHIAKEPSGYILYKIRREAILFITDKILSEKYFDNWEQQPTDVLS